MEKIIKETLAKQDDRLDQIFFRVYGTSENILRNLDSIFSLFLRKNHALLLTPILRGGETVYLLEAEELLTLQDLEQASPFLTFRD